MKYDLIWWNMKERVRYFMRSLVPRRKAYYRVTIDYNWDAKKEGRHLHLGHHNDQNTDSKDLLKKTSGNVVPT